MAKHLSNSVKIAMGIALSATCAQAAVTISSQTTQNMSCANGVCQPTAKDAVLNVGDLANLLASGNATVTTTGTGVEANDITVKAALSWSSTGTLSLLAHKSVTIDNPVSVAGLSGLAIATGGSKGVFGFGKTGTVTFANLSSQLTINGAAYTLANDIKSLSSAINANPGGNYALAASYDASGDGIYGSPPIETLFTGTFEGLGNAISDFSLAGASQVGGAQVEGFFAEIGTAGTVRNFGLANADIVVAELLGKFYEGSGALAGESEGTVQICYVTGTLNVMQAGKHTFPLAGGLIGFNTGTIEDSYATESITASKTGVGGLVGWNDGAINNSHAFGTVSGASGSGGLVAANAGTINDSFATSDIGGIVGGGLASVNYGTIADSYATGDVHVKNSSIYYTDGGGLVGENAGSITNSYAMGSVSGGTGSKNSLGGLVGVNAGNPISSSYSTGAVTGGAESLIGGLIGDDQSQAGSLTDTYWDTDTSGQSQGAGNNPNDPGVTGLTTAQFQSGLPVGFDPAVWAEETDILDGFPYLLDNKPAKHK
jgi:hypothetical protein